jgi:hypothetical protein
MVVIEQDVGAVQTPLLRKSALSLPMLHMLSVNGSEASFDPTETS